MARPSITVVVPTLDRPDELNDFVQALCAQTLLPDELIIVDAGTTPEIEALLRDGLRGSPVQLMYLRAPAGTSHQRNVAIDHATGDLLFFFDDDVIIEPDYIQRSVECFAATQDPPVGGVLGTLTNRPSITGVKAFYHRIFGLSHAIRGSRPALYPSGNVRWLRAPNQILQVPVAGGGRVAFRRDCFETDRFDEYLPGYTYNEDVEFSYRVSKRWTILQTPHARAYHKASPTSRVTLGDRAFRVLYGKGYFFYKHMPASIVRNALYLWSTLGLAMMFLAAGVIRRDQSVRDVWRGLEGGLRQLTQDRADIHPDREVKQEEAKAASRQTGPEIDHAEDFATGSGIVFFSTVAARALRLLTIWFLTSALGVADFGLYVYATTVVAILANFAPLGADWGVLMFGVRHQASGERARLKGVLHSGFGVAVISGLTVTGALWYLARTGEIWAPDKSAALRAVAPAVAAWAALLFTTSSLQARKDMAGHAIAYNLVLPGSVLSFAVLAVWRGFGLTGALQAFAIGNTVALVVALVFAYRHYGELLRDRSIRAASDLKSFLAYSVPQGLTMIVFRLNLWMDILMLGWLATLEDVGIYRVAVALAIMGTIPVVAITTMFSPYIAEMVEKRDLTGLERMLKLGTRWLIIVASPLYLVLFLIPDVVLGVLEPVYLQSQGPLAVLLIGQAIFVACAPAARILPMSGHSVLNLIIGTVAAGLNIVLNYVLIPKYGTVGAAVASAITLSLWSAGRAIAVWLLFRCFPFSMRTTVVFLCSITGGLLCHAVIGDGSTLVRCVGVGALLVAYTVMVYVIAWTREDRVTFQRVGSRLRKKLSPKKSETGEGS